MAEFAHDLGYSRGPGETTEIRTACLAPPRCFVPPSYETPKLVGADFDSGIDLWLTAGDRSTWYQLNLEDATGFFGDQACGSERCPGSLMVLRGNPSGENCYCQGVTGTWNCPIGTVKWLSVISTRAISFHLLPNTQFLSEAPNGCVDVANERRCEAQGTYTVLVGSTDPDGCTATSVRDVECPTAVTGINLRGQCEGYADCTDIGERRIESVPFQYPESVVRNWVVTDDSSDPPAVEATVAPTPNPITPAPSPPPVEITAEPTTSNPTMVPPTSPPVEITAEPTTMVPLTGNPTSIPSANPTVQPTGSPSPSPTISSNAASLKKKISWSTIVVVWWMFTFV